MKNDKLKEAKLKPCPFCGNENPEVFINPLHYVDTVECSFCGVTKLASKADDWNYRPLEEKLEKIIEEAGG